MPREGANVKKKINLYDYAPKKNLYPLFGNGQIEAVRMTGAESNLLLLIIVGKVLFSHFPCSREASVLSMFSRAG
jgi:hypothetical protein